MPAYVITDVEITDSDLYGEFLKQVTSTNVEAHGGKFVARGGEIDVILGDWTPKRLAILEFDSIQQVREWLKSPEYVALDDIRSRSSNINMVHSRRLVVPHHTQGRVAPDHRTAWIYMQHRDPGRCCTD